MWFRNIFNVKKAFNKSAVGTQSEPIRTALTPQVLRQVDRLHFDMGQLRLTDAGGIRSSNRHKPSSSFQMQRMYVPGDDVRYVDWKASARQEHVFIKQGAQEKAAMIYILIDCSASMAWGTPSKRQGALDLAHLLGYLALAQHDRLVILPVSDERMGRMPGLGPLSGKGQAPLIKKYLEALRFQGGSDIVQAMVHLPRREYSQTGLVLVISDLLGAARLNTGLEALRAPAWRTALLHLLHPNEIDPKNDGYYELIDIETQRRQRCRITPKALDTYRRRLQEWQADINRQCQENRAYYSPVSSASSLDKEIIPQLIRLRLVKPL